jgi:hypothetical protein
MDHPLLQQAGIDTVTHSNKQYHQPTEHHRSSDVRVKIIKLMDHPVLQQAGIDTVTHSNKQGFIIRAECDPRHFAKEIDLLTFLVVCSGAVHVHEVSRLREEQKAPIRGVSDTPDCPDVAP